jgi:tRNA dimethylallyltransferase
MLENTNVIIIVGPTASGKTALSLQIAQQYNGEIISADSRSVYRGMNIGTAKPDREQQKLAPHHCLDMVNPDETYNAQQFQKDARVAIKDIRNRHKLPVIVGGTGLYINALIYDYKFPNDVTAEQRKELNDMSLEALVERLNLVNPKAAKGIDLNNPRRVIRAIETTGSVSQKATRLPPSHLLIGLNPGILQLNTNIAQRTKSMISQGLVEEAKFISEKYGPDIEPLNTAGYREALLYTNGKISKSEMEEQIILKTRQLAKRQMTWFKRDINILWHGKPTIALQLVKNLMVPIAAEEV